MNQKYDYTQKDITEALKSAKIEQGDSIFIHSNLGFFGRLQVDSTADYYPFFKKAIFNTIGPTGTLVVPTFSYSFCKNEVFNVDSTKSVCGIFSEMVRCDPDALRSVDANFSIAAIGKNAELFTHMETEYSFGEGSFWHKFDKHRGKICNFNFDAGSTYIHYVERQLKVPYRWDKAFKGQLTKEGESRLATFYHYVWDHHEKSHAPDFAKFHRRADTYGVLHKAPLGRGEIVSIRSEDIFRVIAREYKKDPNFLTIGKFSHDSSR